jgi:hypothetical protein
MDQVSRPLQIVLILALAFAGLWFVALRPKSESTSTPAPATTTPAAPKKSAVPGPAGDALDKARETKAQGDAAAAQADATGEEPAAQNTPATPVTKPPPAPAKPKSSTATPAQSLVANSNGVVSAGGLALGMLTAAVQRAVDVDLPRGSAAPRQAVRTGKRSSRPGYATPGKVRRALAGGHAVVLLFYSARGSDDRAVRGELAAVSRRRGKVNVWAVSVRGLPRFKNILRSAQVIQSPTVVVLGRSTEPVLFPGYTDRGEIDQATAVVLGR